MSPSRAFGMGLLCLLATAMAAQAMPLDLTPTTPDIYASGLSISYNATTDVFTATGPALSYDGPPLALITGGAFSLTALIDEEGDASSGLLIISGATTMKDGTPVSGVLLTADLRQFGFAPDGSAGPPVFEFVSALTGGMLAPDFGPVNLPIGTILTSFDVFTGSFEVDYQSSVGKANTFAVPEPTSVCLLGAGALSLLVRRRRRTASK